MKAGVGATPHTNTLGTCSLDEGISSPLAKGTITISILRRRETEALTD